MSLMHNIIEHIREQVPAPRPGDPPFLIAIDGRCASGKTTLAAALQRELSATLFHMDDFFLRPEQRTPERLATPGGNVDYERFLTEVLLPIREGNSALEYRPYDCHSLQLRSPVHEELSPIVIVEGSYSCHPALREHYDLHIFLTVDPAEQLRRIEQRGGPDAVIAFREKWIPLEERYFSGCNVQAICWHTFST